MSSAVPPKTAAATGASRHQGGTRARPATARIEDAIIATAVLALLAAAWATGSGSPATVADTPGQQALKYSQCIRSQGVPGFPNPDSQGGRDITPNDHPSPGSPRFQTAQRPCQHLAPGGTTNALTPAHLRQAPRQPPKFVACMRGARWAQNHLSARC